MLAQIKHKKISGMLAGDNTVFIIQSTCKALYFYRQRLEQYIGYLLPYNIVIYSVCKPSSLQPQG